MRMKTILLALMTLLATPLACGNDNELRYDNFVFMPSYRTVSDEAKAIVDNELGEFHNFEKLYGATIQGNSILLYKTRVKKERAIEFREKFNHKKYVLKQKRDYRDRSTWDALSYIDNTGNFNTLSVAKSTEYFSVSGRRDYDYYGCIDSKPVYTAELIEGQPDFFFVITATQGSPVDPLVREYMELSMYSSEGSFQLSEKVFWASFQFARKGPDVHFYGQTPLKPDANDLLINDGHGRKRYAKMYIADLDQDNKLDVLFWFKTYRSTDYSEKIGFRFEKESFSLYSENASKNGFDTVGIETKKALVLLKTNELTWEAGYPHNNALCEGWQSKLSMMQQIVD